MKVRDLEKLLVSNGWVKEKGNGGSHAQYAHETKPGKVTVPMHGGDIPIGTLKSILKQAGIKEGLK